MNYETPEQMARAFLQERLERLSLVDKLGSIRPELSAKEEEVQRLRDERSQLQTEMDKMKATTATSAQAAGAGDSKGLARLQRQKNLVTKEVDYLRAQMKTFEAEEAEFNPEQMDEERMNRIHELEDMVQQYRSEVEALQADLSKAELQPAVTSPKKRAREDDEGSDERLGEMRRKARTLQIDIDKLQTRNQVLEAELKASISQIDSLKESSRTRVLEFRNNPTAEVEAIKMATLRTLREENGALLSQLEGKSPGTKVVPISTLENMRHQLEETKATMAQNDKKTLRLKQIYSSKSLEFREAVCSILGWKLDFMPNGRVKATSILYPSLINNGEEEENSIIFDGEQGTMKVSGGPQSVFANEIKGLIEFWVEG
jgi:mitotic spindle assembly checkpoint protein MAD1